MAKRFKGDIQIENDAQIDNNLSLPSQTGSRVLELDSSSNVTSSSVTSTELGHLSGVTSGVQSQIDDKADSADTVLRDGSQAFTGEQSMGSNKLTNLAAPTNDNDAARLVDVQAAQAGQLPKAPVDVVSTSNITLSGEQTIDGVLTSASRVLVAGQTNTDENGIYVSAAGAWSRASDHNGNLDGEVAKGNTTLVLSGTDNANVIYIMNATDAADPADITPGSESQEWIIYSRAESTQAGDGLNKSGLTFSVDVSDIAGSGLEDDGSNNIRIASSAAGTGLTGGSGSALSVDFATTGTKAVTADNLASNSNGLGASLIGIEDSAGDYTATDVEGALAEIQTDLGTKQNDVITTQGDLVIGNASNEESRLPIGTNGQILTSNGTTASWQDAPAGSDENVKVSANDTTAGYLEDKIVVANGVNSTNPLEASTLNDAGNEDLQIQFDESKVDHDALNNFVANEHVDHSSVNINTNADSGLTGGGDITASRTLSVDINGTTSESSVADGDEILVYDVSAGALRKMTRSDFVGSPGASVGDISETSFSGANNQAAAADVTGFAFANGTVRSFSAHVSILVDATADLYETYQIEGIQKAAGWDISQSSTGDDSNVNFSITSAGQIQYTSDNYAGFSSLTIKFRAITTSV